ncbi:MAG TPA: hypothetical protein VF466_04945 [Candidatus Saccharimonadales bacterium]
MKTRLKQLIAGLGIGLVLALLPAAVVAGAGVDRTSATTRPQTSTNTDSSQSATRLNNIKTKGNAEIDRRLSTLNTLITVIAASAHLSKDNQTALSNQVSTEVEALGQLRIKLDAETTVAGAASDVSSMITEYRVYALIVPKVRLLKTADDQLVVEQKLSDLATKLNTRLSQTESSAEGVSALRTKLDQLNTSISDAKALTQSAESGVLPLQPSDYDTDHAILSRYRDQLGAAHLDNQDSYKLAKDIVTGLKQMGSSSSSHSSSTQNQ